jgi:hypothetical protein
MRPRFAAALAATLVAGACAGSAGGPTHAEPSAATVTVSNYNGLDMNIYLVRGSGVPVRLGTVSTMETRRFRLPVYATVSGENYLRAEPIGARSAHSSQPLLIEPGAEVTWRLENNLAHSTISMRMR